MFKVIARVVAGMALVIVSPVIAAAQSGGMFIDGGARTDEYKNGDIENGIAVAGGLHGMLGGKSAENIALLTGGSIELRYSASPTLAMDVNGDLDVMVRLWNLTVGLGGTVRVPTKMREFDYDCRLYVGCPSSGVESRSMDEAVVYGYALSGKFVFGPRGRMFVQGKWIKLDYHLGTRGEGTNCDATYGVCYDTYSPPYLGGSEKRLSAGFVLPGKFLSSTVLRLSWQQQIAEYEMSEFNDEGALNRRSTMMTLGIVWVN